MPLTVTASSQANATLTAVGSGGSSTLTATPSGSANTSLTATVSGGSASLTVSSPSPSSSLAVTGGSSSSLTVSSLSPTTTLTVSPGGGGGGGGGTTFLPTPDDVDDTSSQVHFYFGWASASGGWLVRRQLRSDASTLDATVSNNPAVTLYASAWASRATLNYA